MLEITIDAQRLEIEEGSTILDAAQTCIYRVSEGLEIRTNTPQVIKARKEILEL